MPRGFISLFLEIKNPLNKEQTTLSAQTELFVIAKQLVASLIELKPLGTSVSGAWVLLSVTLQDQYSIILKSLRQGARIFASYPRRP